MKLYFNKPSPYARKVLVVAHEKRLIDRIELIETDPWSDPAVLHAATPIGKVPALVTDDGLLLTESPAIAEHLDRIGEGPALAQGDDVAARAALSQGFIDAAFGTVIERRRPAERQWPDWIARQRRAIERTLARIEVPPSTDDGGRFDLGDIGFAVGLAYLDFRLPEIPWRTTSPTLAAWLDSQSRRPSLWATRPT
jgi:glutathione S-transferase